MNILDVIRTGNPPSAVDHAVASFLKLQLPTSPEILLETLRVTKRRDPIAFQHFDQQYHLTAETNSFAKTWPYVKQMQAWQTEGRGSWANIWNTEVMIKYSERECLLFDRRIWTYSDVDRQSNQAAHWLLAMGAKPKDVVVVVSRSWWVGGLAI